MDLGHGTPGGPTHRHRAVRAPVAIHTYGLLWEPGTLTSYIDGKVVSTTSSAGVPAKDMFVIVSDEVRKDGGEWFGNPDSDTSTRHTKVDWVRAWQRS